MRPGNTSSGFFGGCGQALHGFIPGVQGQVEGCPVNRVQYGAAQIQVRLHSLFGEHVYRVPGFIVSATF